MSGIVATYCAHPGCSGLAYRVGCVYLFRGHRQLAIGSHAGPRPGEHWRRQRTAAACTLCGEPMTPQWGDLELNERQWFEQVRDLLNLYGWRWIHQYDSRRSNPGFPDIFGARRGQLVALELKREGGRLTPDQATWLGDLRTAGVTAAVVMPHDRERLRKLLAGED